MVNDHLHDAQFLESVKCHSEHSRATEKSDRSIKMGAAPGKKSTSDTSDFHTG